MLGWRSSRSLSTGKKLECKCRNSFVFIHCKYFNCIQSYSVHIFLNWSSSCLKQFLCLNYWYAWLTNLKLLTTNLYLGSLLENYMSIINRVYLCNKVCLNNQGIGTLEIFPQMCRYKYICLWG